MEELSYKRVELLAYHIYLAEGRSEGRALQHWLEAEYQVATDAFGDKAASSYSGQDREP